MKPIDFASHTWEWLRDVTARVECTEGSFALTDLNYEISLGEQPAQDAFGEQPWTLVEARDSKGVLDLKLFHRQNAKGSVVAMLDCTNVSDQALHINKLVVIDAIMPGEWQGGSILDISNSHILPLVTNMRVENPFAAATNRPGFVGGFLSTSHYQGYTCVTPVVGGLKVEAYDAAEGVQLDPGETRSSEVVWLSPSAHPSDGLEEWAELAGKWNSAKIWPRNMATWCSWYSGIKQEDGGLEREALDIVPIIAEKFLPLGFECARVVADTQTRRAGDWPVVVGALPSGYAKMADAMRDMGMIPGFWYDVNQVQADSEFATQCPEMLAIGEDGKPLIACKSPTYGKCYLPNGSIPEVVKKYYEDARRFSQTGQRYCFTDYAGQCAIGPESSCSPKMTSVEVGRQVHEAIRRGFGPDFYWLCQAENSCNWGLAESMRTGNDSGGNCTQSYSQAVSKWFLNRHLFLCDPDAWLPLAHSLEADRDWGAYLILTGFAMTIGGDFRGLTPEREELIRRALPPLGTTGRPRDLWEREVPSVLEQRFAVNEENWRVVGLFNWRAYDVDIDLNLDRLWDESSFAEMGLPGSPDSLGNTRRKYLLYDFWPQEMLGIYDANAHFTLPGGSGKVLVIREVVEHPQILSIGDHLVQGGEELQECKWNAERRTLECTTRGLRGIEDTVVRLRVPDGWMVRQITASDNTLAWSCPQLGTCRFVVPDRDTEVTWSVAFDGGSVDDVARERFVNPEIIVGLSVSRESILKLRESMEAGWSARPAERLARILPGPYKIDFYATAAGATGETYSPDFGFGHLGAEITAFYSTNLHMWGPLCLADAPVLSYRVDGLCQEKTYKLGVSLLDTYSRDRIVDIGVRRADNNRAFSLAENIHEPEMFDPEAVPLTVWYDVPHEAIDLSGFIVDITCRAGANAVVGEFWIISKPAAAPS